LKIFHPFRKLADDREKSSADCGVQQSVISKPMELLSYSFGLIMISANE